MIISANQPYFFPFFGFFYKAYLSDILVILDSVQFPRGSTWITRNRFKNNQGSLWLTVPVKKKGLGLQNINSVRIYHDGHWIKKHLASLKNAYLRAPYYKEHINFLEALFSSKFERLIDLNLEIIRYIMGCLRIDTKVTLLSEQEINAKGDRLLIEICKKMGASQFLAQHAALKYLDTDMFRKEGIGLMDFKLPSLVYPQLWGNFIPNLSALDLILNCGPKAHDILINRR
ncbi:MAG: WbqC family protein [Thermodesulfovibrionia bacterium]|nr:WbqC family protein [Thermodesulfovibrionia bacterium]